MTTIKPMSNKQQFELHNPIHSQDMSYHLIDTVNGIEYLIDIEDVHDTHEQVEEFGGITYNELINNIDAPTLHANCMIWLAIDSNGNKIRDYDAIGYLIHAHTAL